MKELAMRFRFEVARYQRTQQNNAEINEKTSRDINGKTSERR